MVSFEQEQRAGSMSPACSCLAGESYPDAGVSTGYLEQED